MGYKKTKIFLSFIVAVIFSQSISFAFMANFTYTGTMPVGTLWNVSVDGTPYNSIKNNITINGLSGVVNYQYTTPISNSPGKQYVCNSGCSGTLNADNNITANYHTQYLLQMSINESGAGTTTPAIGPYWYDAGAVVPISANPNLNYLFSLWMGSGAGSYTGAPAGAGVTMNGPINERGDFTKKTTINFTNSLIPAGTLWGVNVSGVPYTSTGSKIIVSGLMGTFSYTYDSIVPGTTGTRYVCNSGCSGSASSDIEVNANYQTQHLLNMSINLSEAGNTVPPVGTSWRNKGDVIAISVNLNIGYALDNWVGNGAGSYTGAPAGAGVTMNGPINELAKITDYSTYINSITDIQTNCQYFPNSHTYYCTEKLNWGPSGSAAIQETDGPIITNYSLATFTENSTTGSFTGTNPITVNASGTCAPINANASITGICEGTNYKSGDCTSLPEVITTRGYFQKHVITSGGCTYLLCSWTGCSGGASFNTGESCSFYATGRDYWSFWCCYVSSCYATGGSCSVASYNNQENLAANCNWGSQTYYTPCTVNSSIIVNKMFFQYPGMVKNTTSVNLPLNKFKTGTNTLQMSALESRKFNYTLRWTEIDSPIPCVSSKRTKAYQIKSESILQSGESARIINGTFKMKFDSAGSETVLSFLRDDTNAVVSVRIVQFDANNLKLEIYNSTHWNLLANNLQPKTWYSFSIVLNESENKIMLKIDNVEYGTVSRTLNLPASPAIKWISITSNGAWLDDINIDKKDINGNLISTYSDNFESYEDGERVLYSNEIGFYGFVIPNNLNIDLYDGYSVKNIVFKAKNKFDAKTINSANVACGGNSPQYCDYGTVGNIEIQAKKIKFDDLLSYCPGVGEPQDNNCGAATITIKGNNISGKNIQNYGGYDCSYNVGGCYSFICSGRGGGSVYVTGNITNIETINVYGGKGYSSDYAGPGGTAHVDSKNISIVTINAYGPSGVAGGSGGSVIIKGTDVRITNINANGGDASGNGYCGGGRAGSGGPVNIVAKGSVNVSSILTSGGSGERAGGGGSIRVATTNIQAPMNLTANGASGGVFTGTSGNGNEYEYATPASAGGTVNVYADHIDSEVNISITGGNAVGISYFTGFSTGCELGSAGVGGIAAIFSDNQITGNLNINNKGGGGADYRNKWTTDCQILGGSDGGIIIRKRTWGGFVGMNASVLDLTYNSYLIKVKDLWTNRYVRQRNESYLEYYYNKTFNNSVDSGVMVKKIVNAFIGFPGKNPPYLPAFDMALGKDYQLEITASSCDPFNQALCSHENDRTYIVPIVEY